MTKKFYLINCNSSSSIITFFTLPPKILDNTKMYQKSRKKYSQFHHAKKTTA